MNTVRTNKQRNKLPIPIPHFPFPIPFLPFLFLRGPELTVDLSDSKLVHSNKEQW